MPNDDQSQKPGRWVAFKQAALYKYFSVDYRSLALFRVMLSLVLLWDLRLRWDVLAELYSNSGMTYNHTQLWAPHSPYDFSLLFTASTTSVAGGMMVICLLVYLSLLFGFKTRIAHVLALLCHVSLNTRAAWLENGGDMTVNILLLWTMFMPLGARFSLDSLFASFKAVKESASGLNERTPLFKESYTTLGQPRYYSWAIFCIMLQLCVIYIFNTIHKTGETWMQGTSVHYVLHQDALATYAAVWVREHVPFKILWFLSWFTLVIEAAATLLILTPVYTKWARRLAIVLLAGLHLNFALFLELRVFGYIMLCFHPFLLDGSEFDAWVKWRQKKLPIVRVFYDGDCGICYLAARTLARLDLYGRLELFPNSREEMLPPSSEAGANYAALAEESLLAWIPGTTEVKSYADAFALLSSVLPFGFFLSLPFKLPGSKQLFNFAYSKLAPNRAEASAFIGNAACGIREQGGPTTLIQALSPARLNLRQRGAQLVQFYTILVTLAFTGEILNANGAVHKAFKGHEIPALHHFFVDGVRTYQHWRMFAPSAPTEDFYLLIEAKTKDGRIIDPFNMRTSRVAPIQFDYIPFRLNQNALLTHVSMLLPYRNQYWDAFAAWIFAYHERTGKAEDQIVSFKAFRVTDVSPPPGETIPTKVKKVFTYSRTNPELKNAPKEGAPVVKAVKQ